MPFIEPMLAGPLSDRVTIRGGSHVVEQKYDGHRLIVEIGEQELGVGSIKSIQAWSRGGLYRELPKYLVEELAKLPVGIYDGELISANQKSYHVKTKTEQLRYIIFDVLSLLGQDITQFWIWSARRALLEETFNRVALGPSLAISEIHHVSSRADIDKHAKLVWALGGEGLIVKDVSAKYRPGKRGTEFMKVKALGSAVLKLVGFEKSKGEKVYRGPCAVMVLEDADGNRTKVKTLNDAMCHELNSQHDPDRRHPAIGRQVRIEFQERTPDGSYRHPRMDRWEDE